MKYTIQTIVCGAYQENAYLLCPEGRAEAVLIDPGDDLNALRRALSASGRSLGGILLTHGHFDHMLSARPLAQETGARVYLYPADAELICDPARNAYDPGCARQPCPEEMELEALGGELALCGLRFGVLHTPGHTPGSVCLYDTEGGTLFSGDTLFCAGFGRMDLYGGSHRDMRNSLRALFALPGETRVLPGHGCDTRICDERARYHL